ncbi:MAG: GNAT family N-acetyltransferase [Oscillospiraceae bacterium]|nr:GNAT family N-acetyltransferase [Oscillospiraceae bacterium]
MTHLKMYWLKGTPIKKFTLPDGYSFSYYDETKESEMYDLLECWKNGLAPDDADKETFDYRITNHKDTTAGDIIFLDYNGEHIGTVTAVYHPEENIGEFHMVGIRKDFRGKGLGKYLNQIALEKLETQGVDYIYLTTHEWRIGAVKSYLSCGFKPVLYDDNMEYRWSNVLAYYNIDSVDMLNEDGSFYKEIRKSDRKFTEESFNEYFDKLCENI